MPKLEKRGKYAGVKVHLDGPECQALLDWYKGWKNQKTMSIVDSSGFPFEFTRPIAKAIKNLLAENPDLLKDRTEAQIAEALAKDKAKIEKQQLAIKSKKDWKEVE